MGGFGLFALCIFLSTIALQALTSPSPAPASFFSKLNPQVWSSSVSSHPEPLDLHVRNLSVHRVRYVDEQSSEQELESQSQEQQPAKPSNGITKTLSDLLSSAAKPRRTEVSSVVVTWEDHPLAAHARSKDEKLDEEQADGKVEEGASYQYEVQLWVSGWGLDGLWNQANRRVKTTDPFVVLLDLPLQHELQFRVRVKVKQTKRSLMGLLPMGLFATDTDGPWSEVATLSPTRDDELEAIVAFLTGNKPFFLVLAVCIGSGCLVVAQLYFRWRLARSRQHKQLVRAQKRLSTSEQDAAKSVDADAAKTESVDSGKSKQELEHEIRDLRQELADSEEEVRHLMLFSGYGIESLAPHELEQLERELKHTLKRVQHVKKHGTPESGMSITVNADRALRPKRVARDALPMSPIYEHRSF